MFIAFFIFFSRSKILKVQQVLHQQRLLSPTGNTAPESTTALTLLAVPGQACVSLPIRADQVFMRGDLKETRTKTETDTVLQNWTVLEN